MKKKNNTQEIDIQQYWLILKRRWLFLVAAMLGSIGLSWFIILRQKPEYQANGLLLFKSDRISSLTKAGEKIGDLESLMREGNPLETQAVIVQSEPILQEVIDTLNLKDDDGKPLEPEALDIKIEPLVGTDVINVSYTDEKPKLAASIVNQVMKSYVDNNIESNRAQVVAAGEFLKKQVPLSKIELEQATQALLQFKNQNQVIQLPEEATAAIQNISRLDGEINQARASLAELTAQESQIASKLDFSANQAVEITSLNQISGVQEVLGELQKVQTQLASERANYTPAHPLIKKLENQEALLQSLLQQRKQQASGTQRNIPNNRLQIGEIKQSLVNQLVQIQTEKDGVQTRLQTLNNIRDNYQRKLAILPNLEKQQTELERRLSVAQTDYENLITRLQEIELAEKQTIGNSRIIQKARVPKKPTLSKMTLLLAGGGVFVGLLFGIAAAFTVDLIDRSLKTVKEIEAFFNYTLVGLIPKFEPDSKSADSNVVNTISPRIIVASSPRTMIHEAYQMLQANLKFISHKEVRTIAVTSSVVGEGKSEVTANLGAILAQGGQKVLIVDADMRQPMQHHLWGLINSGGLSNVIVGQDELYRCHHQVTENLSVLTAGVQPPNPSALIDSAGMDSLIQQLLPNYDYIIFDTPPLAGTPDAAVLGKMVDGVLLVARPRVVDSASATAAKSLLERSEAKVLGIVANAVNVKQEPESYFYYAEPRGAKPTNETQAEVDSKEWVKK
ncbi:MAG: polysaccharide biosynthesis tyrosine autokinase [Rivularia sp. (in: Bacteria)]|nr:polysaccharide biosynthesis tyrosine autokinase [Rivularia sp. MS3]